MLTPLSDHSQIPGFLMACSFEHVFGSRIYTALRTYGMSGGRFFLLTQDDVAAAALYYSEKVLYLSARPDADMMKIAHLIRQLDVHEIDGTFEQCTELQGMLGGYVDTSWFMVYDAQGDTYGDRYFSDKSDRYLIRSGDPETTFAILQASEEYYRMHLHFDPWSRELQMKRDRGLSELYQIYTDGEAVGTGCLVTQDETCGIIGAMAVLPAFRHRGFGSRMTRFLTERILQIGKTPRLVSGYDEVAELYRRCGYVGDGRWGELYLS